MSRRIAPLATRKQLADDEIKSRAKFWGVSVAAMEDAIVYGRPPLQMAARRVRRARHDSLSQKRCGAR